MESQIKHNGRDYKYLFTFGKSSHVYGCGDLRIIADEEGRITQEYVMRKKERANA